jgi:prevent-host-death family protein
MKTVAVGKFKAHCLALINEVARSNESLIITKYNKPVVKVTPYDTQKELKNKPLKDAAIYIGDIISPIDEEWEALK